MVKTRLERFSDAVPDLKRPPGDRPEAVFKNASTVIVALSAQLLCQSLT